MSWKHPTGQVPETVDVVALGASCQAYMRHQLRKDRPVASVPDEVWTVNRGIRLFEADLAFVLDELPDEIIDDPAYGTIIKTYKKPIITTVCSPLAPSSMTYPGAEILDCIERKCGLTDPYWHNSMPMVLAYAWFIGVKQITLWGCDYTLENGRVLEDDRANCEYWVGFLRACGVRVGVPTETTLLNQHKTRGELHIYGLRDQRKAPAFVGL